MKEKTITTTFQVFDNLKGLPSEIQHLMREAGKARDKAYAPYSNFQVGAAVLLENKEVITGSNQENVSYPSGLCAERVAVYYAGAQFPEEKITAIAITAKSLEHKVDSPIPPCGACRQSIAEYETKQGHPIAIYFMGETGKVFKFKSILDLLPLAFKFEK